MNINDDKGFTILETLVSTLLLALTLAAVAGLLQNSFQIARDYKDSVTAAMLAQEGMEMVRERRDQNTDPTQWLDGLVGSPSNCENVAKDCIAKLQNDGSVVFERCFGLCSPYLLFDVGRGVFNHNLGSLTKFKRLIHVKPILPGSDEAEVQVLIEWPGMVSTKSLLLETHLFQWQL